MSRYYSQGPLHSSTSGYHGSSSASASASAGSLNRSGSWTSNYAYGLINLHNRQLLPLAHMSILVEKNDLVAEVEIKQRFITSGIRDTTDVRFTFPVPNGAVLYHFDAVVDGRKVVSIIKEKELIRDEVFDDQIGFDSQDRDNALAVNLGWVLPDKEVVVTLKYVTELSLDVDGERIRFVLPSRITPPQRQEFTPDQRSYNGKPPSGYKLDIVVNITMPMRIMEVECTQPVSYGHVHESNGNQAVVRLGSRVGCLKYDYVLLTRIEKTRVDRVIIEPAKSPSEMAVAMILFHAAFLNTNDNEKDRWTSKQLNLSIDTGDVNVLQITPDIVKIPRSSVVIAYCLLPGFRKDNSSEGTLTLIAKYNDGTTIRVPVTIDQNALIVEGESLHHLHAKSYMKDLERIISTPVAGTSPLADAKSEEIQQEIVRLSTTYSLVSRFTGMSIAEERHSNGKTLFKAIPQPSRKYDTSMDLRGNLPEKLDRPDSRANDYYRSSNGNGDFRSSREGYSAVSSKYVPPMHRSADNIALNNASRDYERGWDGKPERWNGRHLTRVTTTASPDEQMMNWTENEIESSLSSIIGEREPVRRPFERKEPQSDFYERKRLHSHQHYPQTQAWNGLRSSLGSVSIPGKVEEDLPALVSLQQPDGSWLLSRRLENYIPEIMIPIDEVMDSDIQRLARLTQSLDEQFWITMLVVAFLELHNDKSTIEISTAKEKGFLWLSETLGVLGQSVSYWTDRTKSYLQRKREYAM
eukprot:TRINITY_DN639_c0_g1_i1.p1 TRINITY_DN639_c0_g1~~TRINITY_DN639_c0_g1_i1.p1  ORF type:complete len:749 (-),score=125.44 TRINITY_DN639_c0_g1_i1:137-2383(-)